MASRKKVHVAPDRPSKVTAPQAPYASRAQLDVAKDLWLERLDALDDGDFLRLFAGLSGAKVDEVRKEIIGETAAKALQMHQALKLKVDAMLSEQDEALPEKFNRSQFRSFQHQDEKLWTPKIQFLKDDRWNGVSAAAAAKTGLQVGSLWDSRPASKQRNIHLTAWGKLTWEERQKEVLVASSAPGLSRHHWGSDIDLYMLESKAWETTPCLRLAFSYLWSLGMASTWGFVWTYPGPELYGARYTREPWHWSYYPASRAVVERLDAISNESVQEFLKWLWSGRSDTSWLLDAYHWNTFVRDVSWVMLWPPARK